MLTIKKLSNLLARSFLGLIYRNNNIYFIPFGVTRGMRMRYFPSLQYHMILGFYETRINRILYKVLSASQRIGSGKVFCDVGANIGIYSLWFSKLNPLGIVYAFEPMTDNFLKLCDNLKINSLKNVKPVEAACTQSKGVIDFFIGNGCHEVSSTSEIWASNSQGTPKKTRVNSISLDEFFMEKSESEYPDFIKMDIEGGAVEGLKGCHIIAGKKSPIFFIESHTPDEDRAISDFALGHGYAMYRLSDEKWVTQPTKTHPDLDGVWGKLLLIPEQEVATTRFALS